MLKASRATVLTMILLIVATLSTVAAEQVNIQKVSYGGWQNCIRMTNGVLELVVTTDVGPRVIKLAPTGGENLMYENPAELGKTGGNEWHGYGGHRFWIAPEQNPRSYHPDNTPVKYSIEGNTVKLMPGTESTNGMEKELDITLVPNSNHVIVIHKLTNHNIWAVRASPWGLTVLRGDGQAIFPREPYAPHPGIPDFPGQKTDQKYFAPNQILALWSFSKLDDPRWQFTSKYVILKGDDKAKTPQKFGMSNTQSWVAYSRKDQLFVKKVMFQPGATYPDGGCNFESFTYTGIVELESLGPYDLIEPGNTVEHREDWYVFTGVKFQNTDASIDANVLPKVKTCFE